MKYERSKVVSLAKSWMGYSEANGKYKKIIDIYNSYSKLPRGIKMDYDWPWCACTWSAIAIKLGYTNIMPIEISCFYLIENAKKMECWIENDAYIPDAGDAVLYDWHDSGSGDNKGNPDHVGIVVSVDKDHGKFTVIEGNKSDRVGQRTMSINGKFIRGFIAPKYDSDVEESNLTEKTILPNNLKINFRINHDYRVIAEHGLNVRFMPTTTSKIKRGYVKGTVFTCLGIKKEDNGNIWIHTPSGWVCGYEAKYNSYYAEEK